MLTTQQTIQSENAHRQLQRAVVAVAAAQVYYNRRCRIATCPRCTRRVCTAWYSHSMAPGAIQAVLTSTM